ncbi:hypothetical protein VNO78_16168 [Psophocarpus tetragonolobus]|uniref:SBP-type domain-containing protein n=1 Tax=Psophocarpus tetragonolobus TaxID=3891 RepID=A0AAN9SFC7_PSOTE
MLDYEWGSPSSIILPENEVSGGESDQTRRQNFDHNYTMLPNNILHDSTPTTNGFCLQNHFNSQHHHYYHHHSDPHVFQNAWNTSFNPSSSLSMYSLNPISPSHSENSEIGFLLMSKSEVMTQPINLDLSHIPGHRHESGLSLNLGGRTYFSSGSDHTVNPFYRSKALESVGVSSNLPRCQAEGCNADLSQEKHYHRRHKVCEFHSKAATVVAAGLTQRFCQQCSRLCLFSRKLYVMTNLPLGVAIWGQSLALGFQVLSEFDNGKRSCRKRLADHNRRRRKTQQQPSAQEIRTHNVSRSSPESGTQSPPSLKVAVSPPDYFQQNPNGNRGSSSTRTTTSGLGIRESRCKLSTSAQATGLEYPSFWGIDFCLPLDFY